MTIKILGVGSYLPQRVVTNDEIAKRLDTSDEWIFSHTGIRSRHVVADDECTSTMSIVAARQALEMAQVSSDEIGLIVVATSTPDYNTFPATACIVQNALKCRNAGAYDLQAACSGFIYALEQARCWIVAHPDKKAIVIGAETLSRITDWEDRSSCIIFGDGAGAVVLGAVDETAPMVSHTILGADGSGVNYIFREGGSRLSHAQGQMFPAHYMVLDGHPVFSFAVKTLGNVVRNLCTETQIQPDELDSVFAHQANARILEATSRRSHIALDKFHISIDHTGNTSAASIPICLAEALKEGTLKAGDKICLVGFGAGLTYGGTLMAWPYL